MAKIGFVGLGKLGFPVAMTWAAAGHDVVGYDVSPAAKQILTSRKYPHQEVRAQEMIEKTTLRVADDLAEVVAHADIVFLAVQTPHHPLYEGITRAPEKRVDFSYTALKAAVAAVRDEADRQKKLVSLVVISTVLPGTSEREILPLLKSSPYVSYVYSPMFIAMGTVVLDAENPEFVLLGVDKTDNPSIVREFYSSMHASEKLRFMSVASAELTKVSYNVVLGMKLVAANAIMEIAHKTGADCDEVTDALAKATDRVISPKYLRGGMGDGGGCHPRDQIALSWLAQAQDLSFDIFGAMVKAREQQTEWLASLCIVEATAAELPIVILGKAYKRGSNLTTGSPAILLKTILDEKIAQLAICGIPVPEVCHWDPHVDGVDSDAYTMAFFRKKRADYRADVADAAPDSSFMPQPAVFFIGADHDELFAWTFPERSVVIDPWGKTADKDGIRVIRVGRK